MQRGANGEYDVYWKKFAQNLVDWGYGESIIRLAWEFDGSWSAWYAKTNPGNWAAYWRRIVSAMRSVDGCNVRFFWCGCPHIGTDSG